MLSARMRAAVSTRRLALLLGSAALVSPAYAQSAAPSHPAGAQPSGVEEIVVTAQKREQNLQKVPVSVSVMTPATIKANRIENVRDLSAVTPNLVVRYSAGGGNIPNYTMRGIYTSGVALGTDKGVALYIDGVYVQQVVGSSFDFADIARIEVLKGPQGTLFGRNVTGGAISITTKDPTGVFGGYQDLTYGNYDQFRAKTHVDLPKFGPISASITYLHDQRRGDTRNSGAGTQIDYGPATGGALGVLTSPKYLGNNNSNAVNAAVKFDFDPDLYLVYKFDWASAHYTPEAEGIAYLPDQVVGITGPTYISELYNGSTNPKTPISTKRPDVVNNSLTDPGVNRSQGHNLTAKWQVATGISLKNILAYRKSFTNSFFQLDGLGGLTMPTPAGPAPFSVVANTSREDDSQWSDEFQINISNEWFNLTAGYLYFHSHQVTEGYAGTVNVPSFTVFDGANTSAAGTPGVAPGNPGYRSATISVNSNAWFVQPEIHITPKLDIVGGARITMDHKDGDEPYPTNHIDPVTGKPVPNGPDNIIHYRDNGEVTYLAGINYRPTNNILAYAKYSTGYISGGELATITFKPERAFSWEAGAKTEFWNHRFRSNLALFDVKYKSIQYNTAGSLTGVPSAFPYGQATVPVGDARAKGFEWENTLVPIDGLTLNANLGYTDFHYIKGTIYSGAANASGAPGYLVQARPKWTAQLSAQYETQEVFRGGHFVFRLDANMKGKELLTSDIAPGDGPTAQEDPALKKAATVPTTWIVNGRVALTNIDMGFSKAEIAVWTRNMLNNRNMTQFVGFDLVSAGVGLVAAAAYEPARTFGVDASFNF